MQHHFSIRAALAAPLLAILLAACSDRPEPPSAPPPPPPPKPDLSKPVVWKEFAFADKAFVVKVPGDPICQQNLSGSLGAHMCMVDSERTGLMFSFTKLKAGDDVPAKAAGLIAGTMEGSAKDLNGNVASSADAAINGLKGKEYLIKSAEGEYRARIFMTKAYLVQTMGRAKADPAVANAEIDLFLNSLTPAAAK